MLLWHKLEITHLTQLCAEVSCLEWTHIEIQIQRSLLVHRLFAVKQEPPVWKHNELRNWAMGFDNVPSLYLPRIHFFQVADYQPSFMKIYKRFTKLERILLFHF